MYRPPSGPVDRLFCLLIQAQKLPYIGTVIRQCLKLRGIDVPPAALCPGRDLILRHGGNVVVHVKARLGDHIMIHQGVTIGRADVWRTEDEGFGGFEIGDYVVLGANAVVVCHTGVLRVGEGTVVGANSVLRESTGEYEIWAGVPARKIGLRERL